MDTPRAAPRQAFQGRHGRAYLFNNVYVVRAVHASIVLHRVDSVGRTHHPPCRATHERARVVALHTATARVSTTCQQHPALRVNVVTGPREDRQLITGLHTVCDIQCTNCGAVLGWKYVRIMWWRW